MRPSQRRTAAICETALDVVERIGLDAAIEPGELGPLGAEAAGAAPRLWAAYDDHWGRFCGAGLDPLYWHLEQPSRRTGSVHLSDTAPIAIVGTGPSLAPTLSRLKRARAGIHLFTSPRGAEALAAAGLVPDLVLVEHQSPLDAMFSVSDLAHRPMRAMTEAPLVAATPPTPAALLASVAVDRLFVPDPLPTWGLWPATAVALAIRSGARTVALVGIDLGTLDHPDLSHEPLRALLALLAAQTPTTCVDAGPVGAAKPGWPRASIDDIV
jgi:hypothetical protein